MHVCLIASPIPFQKKSLSQLGTVLAQKCLEALRIEAMLRSVLHRNICR